MKKILIVNSNYYKKISNNLVSNAIKKLSLAKMKISILNVPGIFEIPIAIRKNIKKIWWIRNGFINLSILNKKPIGNGVITALNKVQAKKRCKSKGLESARAVFSVLHNAPTK